MKRSALVLLSATACIMAGCHRSTDTTATNTNVTTGSVNASDAVTEPNNPAPAAVSSSQAFVNAAAASDAFEIESSKLAADNSSSAAVKRFATQMIAAHTASTEKLKSVASSLGAPIAPDPTLDSAQQAKLDELKTKKAADFDKTYVADQVAAHEQALTKLNDYASVGDVAQLKQFAADLTPKVAAHLNMAKALKP